MFTSCVTTFEILTRLEFEMRVWGHGLEWSVRDYERYVCVCCFSIDFVLRPFRF
jgi:hypothetical protein